MILMAKSIDDRIAEVKAKRDRLNERLETKLSKLEKTAKTKTRKRDTRRKIIVGGTILGVMEKIPAFKAAMCQMLDETLTRPADREALADLLPAPAPAPPPAFVPAASLRALFKEPGRSAPDGQAGPAPAAVPAPTPRPPLAPASFLARLPPEEADDLASGRLPRYRD
jgi:hypothetical protein